MRRDGLSRELNPRLKNCTELAGHFEGRHPTELHGRGKLGFFKYVIVNSPMGNTSATAAKKKLAGIAPRSCGSYVLKIELNRVKKRLEADDQSDKISG